MYRKEVAEKKSHWAGYWVQPRCRKYVKMEKFSRNVFFFKNPIALILLL